jgi:hypothetical protein
MGRVQDCQQCLGGQLLELLIQPVGLEGSTEGCALDR